LAGCAFIAKAQTARRIVSKADTITTAADIAVSVVLQIVRLRAADGLQALAYIVVAVI
jgi:hypothetical protein